MLSHPLPLKTFGFLHSLEGVRPRLGKTTRASLHIREHARCHEPPTTGVLAERRGRAPETNRHSAPPLGRPGRDTDLPNQYRLGPSPERHLHGPPGPPLTSPRLHP